MSTRKAQDLEDFLGGRRAIVHNCEASEHGNNPGCLCDMIGDIVTIKGKRESMFVGTSSFHLEGTNKTARLSEITLLTDAKGGRSDQQPPK